VIQGLRVPVRLTSRESLHMLDLVEIWAARTGQEVRLVSANDHVHTRGSAHYAGLALDLHSSDPDGLADTMRQAGYRVLWRVPGHYGHVHVEPQGAGDLEPRPNPPLLARRVAAVATPRAGGSR